MTVNIPFKAGKVLHYTLKRILATLNTATFSPKRFLNLMYTAEKSTHPVTQPVPIVQMVERSLREREVVGLIPGRAIPKALKMVPLATLLGAQHYKARTGSPLTHY